MEHHKPIAILYHGGCPDGFGGAYAAWKKFGDAAEYIPVKHGNPPPENLAGRKLYLVDFCYPREITEQLMRDAKSFVVLDHHLGIRDVVESVPEHVFDVKRSGATIAWNYFHPETQIPVLLNYVEDGDLYLFKLPDSRAILSYVYAQPFHFETWDVLATKLASDAERYHIIERGAIYAEHFAILVEQIAHKAVIVSFEGYECFLAGASDQFASDVGNKLVQEKPPIGIVLVMHGNYLNVSLRSNSSVDVAAIARKYGGNGHPQASGFRIQWGAPLPWTVLEEHANARH